METHYVNGERIEVPNLVLAAGAEAIEAFVAAPPAERSAQLARLQAPERARLAPPAVPPTDADAGED